MSCPPDSADRRFGRALVAATLLVVLGVAGQLFLRSDSGRTLIAGRNLAATLDAPITLEVETGDTASRRLGQVRLDSRRTYLVTAELGPGGEVVLVGANRREKARVQFRCPSRKWRGECQRILDARDLPETLHFRVVYKGRATVELHDFRVAPISPAYAWLPGALRVVTWMVPLTLLWVHRRRLKKAASRPRPLDDVCFSLLIFAICLQVFYAGPVQQVLDSRYVTAVSHNVLHGEGVSLPESLASVRPEVAYQIERVGDRLVPYFSPVPAILDVPVVAAHEWLGLSPEQSDGGWNRTREIHILRVSAALVAAALCVLLYRIARRFLSPPPAIVLTFAFAFGTQILSTLSRPYWAHTWSSLLAAAAVLLLLSPTDRPIAAAAGAASLVSLAVYCRPQVLWTVIALGVALALTRSWRRLGVFVGVGALWALLGLVASLWIYETALPSYFFASQVSQGRIASIGSNRYWYGTGTLGALVSPGRGLFVYVPIYLWVLYGVLSGWRSLASRAWTIAALLAVIGHGWLIVATGTWPGGQSYGARQFSDVLVWFFLLAVFAVESLSRRWPGLTRPVRWAHVVAILALLSFSVFVNARGAYSKATWHWQSFDRPPRWVLEGTSPPLPQPWVWNWRYPQFLAGLLPLDAPREPPESR